MSNVRAVDYAEFFVRRMADLNAAATSGDGWPVLGRLWDVSPGAANEWARQNAPKEVCAQIGKNGKHTRKGPRLQSKPKPSNVIPFAPTRRHVFCNHWSYAGGTAIQCGAPTENGKHACPECLKIESLGSGQKRAENVLGLRSGRRPG